MKRDQGNILAIVLILMIALYLLAEMMFIVNRQYTSGLDMAQESAINRQELLDVARRLVADVDINKQSDQEVELWSDCDPFVQPEYKVLENHQNEAILYQYAELEPRCYDGELSYRFWLMSDSNYSDRLVVDRLIARDEWQSSIHKEDQWLDIVQNDDAWMISVNNGESERQFILMSEEVLPELIYQAMRIHNGHYEMVLMFEDSNTHNLTLYHLWIPIAELSFDAEMIFIFNIAVQNGPEHSEIVTMNLNDERNANWRINLGQQTLESIVIRNQSLFVTLSNREENKIGIIAMYLMGDLFLSERLLGYEQLATKNIIEFIKCRTLSPLIISGQWLVGCDVQQKIRYYFPE